MRKTDWMLPCARREVSETFLPGQGNPLLPCNGFKPISSAIQDAGHHPSHKTSLLFLGTSEGGPPQNSASHRTWLSDDFAHFLQIAKWIYVIGIHGVFVENKVFIPTDTCMLHISVQYRCIQPIFTLDNVPTHSTETCTGWYTLFSTRS